jgi:hypothetical protein
VGFCEKWAQNVVFRWSQRGFWVVKRGDLRGVFVVRKKRQLFEDIFLISQAQMLPKLSQGKVAPLN